jgi:hypothetical protein
MCARPRKREDDSGDGDDDDDDDNDNRSSTAVDYVHDDTKEEDLEVWSTTGSTEFKGVDEHFVRDTLRGGCELTASR